MLEAIDELKAIARFHGIDSAFERCGYIMPAHSRAALDALDADLRWLAENVGDRTPQHLDEKGVHRELGSSAYVGGYLDPRGGAVQPLDYVRGLAASLHSQGLPIFVDSPIVGLDEDGRGVVLSTRERRIRARRAILATNAYTAMALRDDDLRRRIVPVSSSVIATEPLPPEVVATILPTRRVGSDTKHLLHAFRMLPNHRLMFSGRGDITGRRDTPMIYRGLEKGLRKTFPQARNAAIEHRWSGMVAVTADHFPHIGQLGERVFYGIGYGGRGVALSHLFGKYLARLAQDQAIDLGPMSASVFRPFPFHGFRIPVMKLAANYYRLRDAFGL
jgi:glycine/D-amino acid oxidase-like deaminating enzyme